MLTTVKSSSTANYAAAGEEIDYTITVTNTGNVTVDAVDVSDPNADPGSIVCVPATPLTLAPGEFDDVYGDSYGDAGRFGCGQCGQHGDRGGTDPGGNPVTDPSDPVTVPAVQSPGVDDGEVVVDGELAGGG